MNHLFAKYDIPAPRYTSYPTVPYWEEAPSTDLWIEHLKQTLSDSQSSWAMYMHVPYCESLCTFCGCNTIITKDHRREEPYAELILKEWQTYLSQVPALGQKALKHLHIGGGTPTFLSPENLVKLLKPILSQVKLADNFEGSIEVDPRRTTTEQLIVLKELGFDRVSLGVQDFNPEVQRLVNRIQPYEITEKITSEARRLGYRSVNFDLIYGLAKQTPETMLDTVQKTVQLRPDRIALYSFALVPWIKPAQRLFKDEDLPTGKAKRDLYELARRELIAAGYVEVGMDHFALPTDSLSQALLQKKLHRNFMGYTDQKTDLLLGLGVSSISETPYSFHQNEKVFATYQQRVEQQDIPTHRGHILSEEDRSRRVQILQFMTNGTVELDQEQKQAAEDFLKEMILDDLVQINGLQLQMTEKGKPFLRNACLFFDERLKRQKPQTQVFSKSL
ncbi:coproporphyrinogen III oxidase [Pseudobdellovibrio exovorus JSS]|uniref:Coproporphyrinogen-III oxidase n=1 Tax=Pseudobdellovibrio exovorus JSS TaxID=1184267 RepID=M4V902_9BACT|nr:oxygen-independent coproporphyrinogen III oxidase [Pseudobdellovibrio exovorus]AGH95887.1 coproporphyrinogen III oxidase [Pseudobdellovibrio exovorus JSS]